MHILITPSWYPTTDRPIHGIFFQQQARALSRVGIQLGVIYPHYRSLTELRTRITGWPNGIEQELDGDFPVLTYSGWSWIPRAPRIYHRNWLNAGVALFKRYVEQYGVPDLIHAQSIFRGGILAAQLQAKYGIPYVVTEHSSVYAVGQIRPSFVPSIQTTLANASARLVVSPNLGEILENKFGNVANPWVWIPNMLDPAFEESEIGDLPRLRSTFQFLNAAFLNENKRHTDLLQAFAERFDGNHSVQLRLAGDGPCRSALEQQAESLGISTQVTFLGLLDRRGYWTRCRQPTRLYCRAPMKHSGLC